MSCFIRFKSDIVKLCLILHWVVTVHCLLQISSLLSNITGPASPLNFLIIHGTADGEHGNR